MCFGVRSMYDLHVKDMVRGNSHMTARKLVEDVGILKAKRHQSCSETDHGSFTMTMHLLTQSCQFASSVLRIRRVFSQGQIVNREYRKCVLQRLRENIRIKKPELW